MTVFPADDEGLAINCREISDQIRSREHLKHQEARFRSLIEALDRCGLGLGDRRGSYLVASVSNGP
ncbi:MAG: hypothetical protein EA417_10765 [Gammaproteobacteria bacterium]|nr:MAG: hypothetical protein EA417_10765 [Gammaproteobacteria bacterium]